MSGTVLDTKDIAENKLASCSCVLVVNRNANRTLNKKAEDVGYCFSSTKTLLGI